MATDYTSFLDALSSALDSGDLLLSNPTTGRLPGTVEATLPAVIGKGVPNGVAALNGSGKPIDTAGNAMAVIGTVSGTAADAAVVAGQISTAQAASSAAVATAAGATTAANNATAAAASATTAANNAATATANKVGTATDSSRVPEARWYPTRALGDAAAVSLADGTLVFITAAA